MTENFPTVARYWGSDSDPKHSVPNDESRTADILTKINAKARERRAQLANEIYNAKSVNKSDSADISKRTQNLFTNHAGTENVDNLVFANQRKKKRNVAKLLENYGKLGNIEEYDNINGPRAKEPKIVLPTKMLEGEMIDTDHGLLKNNSPGIRNGTVKEKNAVNSILSIRPKKVKRIKIKKNKLLTMQSAVIDENEDVIERIEESTTRELVLSTIDSRKDVKKKSTFDDFTLIGDIKMSEKNKVRRVLPHWLANPIVINRDLQNDLVSVDAIANVHPLLITKLKEMKIDHYFPVQTAIIPEVLRGVSAGAVRYHPRDVCVSAPTGSGKTLAFVLPIVQALIGRVVPRIRALVILPTQELAVQVCKVFQSFAEPVGLVVGLAVGLKPLAKEQKTLVRTICGKLDSRIDILVATPGRLTDHLRLTEGMDLSALRFLVLDEADRILASEGGDWVDRIERAIKQQRAGVVTSFVPGFMGIAPLGIPTFAVQKLLFSATLSHDPEQLQHVFLHHPKLYSTVTGHKNSNGSESEAISLFTRPAELTEQYVVAEPSTKPLLVHHLLETMGWRRTLVFTNSVETTHKLAVLLRALAGERWKVSEFSSRHGKLRKRIVAQFTAGKIDILVTTDAMARGLDIHEVEHVISYDVSAVNTYIHRIGRTARAGKPGTSLLIGTSLLANDFQEILSQSGELISDMVIQTSELQQYEVAFITALEVMKREIETEKDQERQKQHENQAGIKGRKRYTGGHSKRRNRSFKGLNSSSLNNNDNHKSK